MSHKLFKCPACGRPFALHYQQGAADAPLSVGCPYEECTGSVLGSFPSPSTPVTFDQLSKLGEALCFANTLGDRDDRPWAEDAVRKALAGRDGVAMFSLLESPDGPRWELRLHMAGGSIREAEVPERTPEELAAAVACLLTVARGLR